MMEYDPVLISDEVTKSVLDIKFPKGISVSYASKNIYDFKEEVIEVPEGITIQGPATFLGMEGNIILNINEEALLGVFHFSTVGFAGGNVVVFEENLETSNNIIIKLGKDVEKEN